MSKNRSKTNEPRVCLTEDQKIAIARWILLHKNVLFGKHSYAAGITNASKKLKWQEIHDQAVAAGFPVRDANHTREASFHSDGGQLEALEFNYIINITVYRNKAIINLSKLTVTKYILTKENNLFLHFSCSAMLIKK